MKNNISRFTYVKEMKEVRFSFLREQNKPRESSTERVFFIGLLIMSWPNDQAINIMMQ